MVGLSDDGVQFLDGIWNGFRKTLPDSALGIFDTLRADVFEKMAVGFGAAVERRGAWLKNDMLMVLVDLVVQKMRETENRLIVMELKIIRDTAAKRVLEQLKK